MGGDYKSTTPINFLANLEGRHSIIGRSIKVTRVNNSDPETVLLCCPIEVAPIPAGFSTQVAKLEEQYNIKFASSYSTNVAVPNNGSGTYGGTQAVSRSSSGISTAGGVININL